MTLLDELLLLIELYDDLPDEEKNRYNEELENKE